MLTYFYMVICALTFGVAIYSTVCLVQNGHNAPDVIFAYVIMECVLNYLAVMRNCYYAMTRKSGADCTSCLGLTTYIWNIILISSYRIFYNINEHPYYTFIFVQFIIYNTMIILAICFVMFDAVYHLIKFKKHNSSESAIQL